MSILFLFILSTIGLCHIIVDGSIMEYPRNLFKSLFASIGLPSVGHLVDCHLCTGFWSGLLMGYHLISHQPWHVFSCGCAGAFVSLLAFIVLNYLEANSLVHLKENE